MEEMLDATARAEARHFWFRGLRRYARALLDGRLPPGAMILDCGAGTGHNLAWLEASGWAMGVERSPTGLAFAHAAHRRIARATVAALPCPDETFDLATSFDVLYCLPDEDERRALEEMWRVLKPGGLALFNVAALDSLRGAHSVLTMEMRRYTRTRLRMRLERAGFRIRRLTYTNMSTLPLMLGVRVAQRLTGAAAHASDSDFDVPPAPINRTLAAMLGAEAWLIGRGLSLPVGSSLLCLAEKPVSGSRGSFR
jgi:ubiquinone/menaquinone biosynthesis C-methylase UbiE